MTITLYVNLSERNRVTKNLTESTELTGHLRGESSVTNPVIEIAGEDLTGYNYAYIEEFDRYYFVDNITSYRTGIWRFYFSVDVLSSFATAVGNVPVIVDRTQTNNANPYIQSEVWVQTVKDKTDIVQFPYGLSENGEFILITAGG